MGTVPHTRPLYLGGVVPHSRPGFHQQHVTHIPITRKAFLSRVWLNRRTGSQMLGLVIPLASIQLPGSCIVHPLEPPGPRILLGGKRFLQKLAPESKQQAAASSCFLHRHRWSMLFHADTSCASQGPCPQAQSEKAGVRTSVAARSHSKGLPRSLDLPPLHTPRWWSNRSHPPGPAGTGTCLQLQAASM